jgi:hypothetical protein
MIRMKNLVPRSYSVRQENVFGCHQAAGSIEIAGHPNHLPTLTLPGALGVVFLPHAPKHEIPEMHATFT